MEQLKLIETIFEIVKENQYHQIVKMEYLAERLLMHRFHQFQENYRQEKQHD